MPIFTRTPVLQPGYNLATHFILVQAGCGVWCVPSHNIQNITKYAAPNKEISLAELRCCVVTLLLLGIYQEGI